MIPWKSILTINSMVFPKRPPYFSKDLLHQQFQGTIVLMVFDLQEYVYLHLVDFYGKCWVKNTLNPIGKQHPITGETI